MPRFLRFLSSMPIFFEPDGGNNPSGGASGDPSPDTSRAVENLIARHQNDMRAVVDLLYRENHDYRQQNATLRGQVPATGSMVLSAEDATRWQAYQGLGDLDTLRTQLSERESATASLQTLQRDLQLRDVAEASGFDREALSEIGGSWTFEIKDEQVDGKAAKVVYVKDGDQETKLTEHPKVQKFMAVLKPAAVSAPAPRGTPAAQSRQAAKQDPQDAAPRRSLVSL